MSNRQRFITLFQALLAQDIRPEEEQELWQLIDSAAFDQELSELIGATMQSTPVTIQQPAEEVTAVINAIVRQQRSVRSPARVRTTKRTWIVAAAATFLLALTVFLYTVLTKKGEPPVAPAVAATNDLPPGGDRATLTLADGTHIILDSAAIGAVARQGGTNIAKTADGQLVYNAATQLSATTLYNTINIPRSGQYKIRLPDGSMVWLNAATKLRYPVAFTGATREVELEGEAYFEVAHNASRPFIVHTQREDVQVLGTHFNINAYADEPVSQTTLLEGKVKVTRTDHRNIQRTLIPGQQVLLAPDQPIINLIQNADTAQAIAWKNGLFRLTNTPLPVLLRQLERWYDVTVKVEGHVADDAFTGTIPRSMTLGGVLKGLAASSSTHFRLEGKQVIVY